MENKKEVNKNEQITKNGYSKIENMAFKSTKSLFEILISTIKRVEDAEKDSFEIFVQHNPDHKSDNPWENLDEICRACINRISSKYKSYLKKNNIKAPKGINTKTCVITPCKQVKTIK